MFYKLAVVLWFIPKRAKVYSHAFYMYIYSPFMYFLMHESERQLLSVSYR